MKYIKYLVFSFIIFCFFIPVFAEDTLIKGVTLKEVSGNVVVGETLIDGDTIQPDIVFYDEGDSVSYQIDLNYDTNLYLIDSVQDNNENNSIKTNYSYKEDKLFMTIFYDEKVSSHFELEPITLKILLKEKALNPKTGYSDWLIIIFVCFVLFTFFYSLIRYRKSLVLLLLFIPAIVFAKDNDIIEITINTEKIKVSYTVHFHKSDDVTGEMEDISCVPGEGCTLPEVTFQKDGNIFLGWALSVDGESVYLDQENVENFMELLENNEVTLYPLWAPTINNFDYTGAVQTYIVPKTGRYKLETWGAQGGQSTLGTISIGGKGGYSYGTVSLTLGTTLYVYVGCTDGYNGGGEKGTGLGLSISGSGGGATHISNYNCGELKNCSSNRSSILIVAGGGGGGAGNHGSGTAAGGAGGGLNGLNGSAAYGSNCGSGTGPGGGTQTSGGLLGSCSSSSGSFGLGGTYSSGGEDTGGGGGGGWYGGASGGYGLSGGGGSGYISSSLTNSMTIAGNTSFPSPSGETETGHSGNGYARITYLGS